MRITRFSITRFVWSAGISASRVTNVRLWNVPGLLCEEKDAEKSPEPELSLPDVRIFKEIQQYYFRPEPESQYKDVPLNMNKRDIFVLRLRLRGGR